MIDDILKAPDFSLDNINIGEHLDSLPFGDRNNAFNAILNKLAINGEIALGGNDIGFLTKLICSNSIDTPGGNSILEQVKSMSTLNEMDRTLQQHNLKVVKKDISGYKYMIVARRLNG